ncbi:MAG: STAS domain-containing protein [Comamonas sp.]
MSHTIALPAQLSAATVLSVQSKLLHSMQALPVGIAIVFDASGVQSFDSAGLALLLACRRAAQSRQQRLHVQGWTPSLQSLAQVYGVLPLLDAQASAVSA